ncbi:hypothetical protein [Microbacterium halophytorum]|uniref:hypothetical protein n=1 Tax=Microbacterium halophytorum TaxID=2067568 RepID=UPI000CFC1283|nr:hypothetical protein [Microbacterium halophytorum]
MNEMMGDPPTQGMSKLVRGAIYIAIGALVLAALVCVAWVFVPDQGDLIGRAFLTVLLLSGFSGAVLLDANLASRRPDWLALASTVSWIVALIVGAFKIWVPRGADEGFAWEAIRVWELILVVGLLQLALLHQRLYWKAHARYVTGMTRAVAIVTTALLVALVGMLSFYLAVPHLFDYDDWYWRVVVSVAILASVGTLILPLINALFAPRPPRPQPAPYPAQGGYPQPYPQQYAQGGAPYGAQPYGYPTQPPAQPVPPQAAAHPAQQSAPVPPAAAQPAPPAAAAQPAPAVPQPAQDGRQPWPMFPDGHTPLPYLPNGEPDFAAAQTGVPSPGARFWGAA